MNLSPRLTRQLPRVFLLLAALAALALAGCDKNAKPVESKEGGRIFLNGLFYQVQLSRMLNPKDVEDGFYLTGQPAPGAGERYFGVFVRVENEDSPKGERVTPISIDHMKIKNAKGNEFEPIVVKGEGWGYEPAPLGKGAHLPIPDTPADIGPIRGGVVLFKLSNVDLDSRPLKLDIDAGAGKTGEIILDV